MKFKHAFVITAIAGTLGAASHPAAAQKLPDSQETGFRAPATIKVDGKSPEWADGYQAFNKNNQLYYTVSNDDDNLYLAVQVADRNMINKIIRGGLTFTINKDGKKKEKDGIAVTFPVPSPTAMRDMMMGMRSTFQNAPSNDPAKMAKQADSVMYAMNRQQIDKLKDIKITGVKDIPDSVLSIYNEEGVKARALFDLKGAYNYELALPLKYLGMTVANAKEFTYNIKLNGLMSTMTMMITDSRAASGMGGNTDRVVVGGSIAPPPPGAMVMTRPGGGRQMDDMMALLNPTDFWGKYILVGK